MQGMPDLFVQAIFHIDWPGRQCNGCLPICSCFRRFSCAPTSRGLPWSQAHWPSCHSHQAAPACVRIRDIWSIIFSSIRFSLRSEEHTSELQSLMRTSYAVFCLKKTTTTTQNIKHLVYDDT